MADWFDLAGRNRKIIVPFIEKALEQRAKGGKGERG